MTPSRRRGFSSNHERSRCRFTRVLDPLQVIAVSADLIVEAREASGIVALGFATFYATGNSPAVPELRVCYRLRMSIGAATDLRTMLDSILKGAMAPKGEAH